MKTDSANVIKCVRLINCFEGSDFMNGCSSPRKNLPANSCFTPQIEISVQSHQHGTNSSTIFVNQNEGRIAEKEQTDKEF
jgi:hypothetical protein